MFQTVTPGWGSTPLVLSYVAFFAFLASVCLVVLTVRKGLGTGLNRSVAGFGVFYGLWSLAYTVLYASPGGASPAVVFLLATVGMFGFPVASLGITFSLGSVSSTARWFWGTVMTATALGVVVYSGAEHRFFPELLALSLDQTPVSSAEALIPWGVYAVNGLGFAFGFAGLLKTWRALPSRRLRRQVTLVVVQLVVGVVAYLLVSLVEIVVHWPPVGVLALLYSLFLNFYLVWKYRYLSFDLPHLGPEIIDGLGEAVLLLDPRGEVRKANPAAGRLFPLKTATFDGRNFSDLFDDPSAVSAAVKAVGNSGEALRLSGLAVGSATASVSITPHFDHFGDLAGLVAIVERSEAFDGAAVRFGLSPREKEVAHLLIQGLSVRQMAEASFVSEATIKTHLLHLYRKSGATNRITFLQKILQGQ